MKRCPDELTKKERRNIKKACESMMELRRANRIGGRGGGDGSRGGGGGGRGGGGGDSSDDDSSSSDSSNEEPIRMLSDSRTPGSGDGRGCREGVDPSEVESDEEEDDDDDMFGALESGSLVPAEESSDGAAVHVPNAKKAFRDFLRNFVEVKEEDEDIDDDENSEEKIPVYLLLLEKIVLGRVHVDRSDAALLSGRVSLGIDASHMYSHSPECRRLYAWLVDYPSEVEPLMNMVLGRELETLRDQLRLQQEERLADAEARGDEDDAKQARDVLCLLPDALPQIQCRPFNFR